MNAVSIGCLLLALALLLFEIRWMVAVDAAAIKLARLQNQLLAVRVQYAEFTAVQESKAQIALVQGVAEQLINSSTDATRETHRLIADASFTALEGFPATRDAVKAARGVHDVTSTGVYAAVSLLNREAGKGLRSLLKTGEPARKPAQKKPLRGKDVESGSAESNPDDN